MRLSDREIRGHAVVVRAYCGDVITRHGCLTNEDVRAAVVAARKDGHRVPNMSSERSLAMLESAMVEL